MQRPPPHKKIGTCYMRSHGICEKQLVKFPMVIKLEKNQGLPLRLPWPKNFATRMLTRDLLAVANHLVFLLSC